MSFILDIKEKTMKDLKMWMDEHHVTATQLADILNVNQDTIYRALQKKSIGKELAWRISMLTGANLVKLLYPNLPELIKENENLFVLRASL